MGPERWLLSIFRLTENGLDGTRPAPAPVPENRCSPPLGQNTRLGAAATEPATSRGRPMRPLTTSDVSFSIYRRTPSSADSCSSRTSGRSRHSVTPTVTHELPIGCTVHPPVGVDGRIRRGRIVLYTSEANPER